MLGFAAVLVISAASLGIAWLGFERISDGVMSYRNSVTEADLARNIDRELISYRSLARYYVITAKDDDAKAALAAEASLRDAILQSMKGSTNPARIEQIVKLEREFRIFAKIFAEILKVKRESAMLTQNQLTRGGTMLRYKFDDLASIAAEAELPAVELGAKQVTSQYLSVIALANTFVINSDQTVAVERVGAAQIRREFAARDILDRREDRGRDQGNFRPARRVPANARQTGRQCEIDR